jgi:hypothetical protein
MGMVLALALLVGIGFAGTLFVHALRADPSERAHGWLVIVPFAATAAALYVS